MSDPTSQDGAVPCAQVQSVGKLKCPLGACTQSTHIYHVHTHIYSRRHGSQTDTQTHEYRQQNSLILLLSLSEQDGVHEWQYTYTYKWVQSLQQPASDLHPASCWAWISVSPVSGTSAHNPQGYSLTAASGTDDCRHKYTHRVDKDSPVLNSWPLGLRISSDRPGKAAENAPFPTFNCSPLLLWGLSTGRFLMVG